MRNIKNFVYDTNEVIELIYNQNILKTNISTLKNESKLSYINYFYEYDFRLKDVEQSFKDGRKNIKYFKYEIAFEFTKDLKYLKRLVNNVIKYITGNSFVLEYVAFVNERKNKVSIILFDRYFYPESKEVEVLAKNDWKNGKFKKGDVIKKKRIYLSEKLRYFNFASKKQLANYFETMRLYLIDNKPEQNDEGILSDKKLKQSNERYVRVKRKDLFYTKLREYKMRKIRAINTLIRQRNLQVIKVSQEAIERLKGLINTPYDVSKFEEETLELMTIK